LAVVAMVLFSLVCVGLLAGPAWAAEKDGKDEKKIVEKTKPDIWDVKEEALFFGIERSSGEVGCTPMTSFVLLDLTGSTFVDDVFSPDTTHLSVGGTDPVDSKGTPGKSRKSEPGGGKKLSSFSITGNFP
jgi:hypothetical protein